MQRHYRLFFALVAVGALLAACGNETARAPVPTAYDWPNQFGYRIMYAARTLKGAEVLGRYDASKNLRFAVRDDGSFLVWHDSVKKVEARRGEPAVTEPLRLEDTLRYFVRLSRWGEFLAIEPGCDPALSACREVPPSALPREMRRLIPRLPVWWPPKGHEWRDTLAVDDGERPGGARGTVATVYRAARDTAVGGEAYWVVTWRSVWRGAGTAGGGAIVAGEPTEESGVVWVDKRLLIPALVEWEGTTPSAPEPRSAGATRTEVRGRAMLMGSMFDSLRVAEEAR